MEIDDIDENMEPEIYAVKRIVDLLHEMDGMTNCMALGILECVKQEIFEMMQGYGEGDDYGSK